MASNPMQKTEVTESNPKGTTDTDFEIRGEQAEANMVEGLTEIGGIALGTVAFLVPGLGPVLSGGPIVGRAVGDTVGHYMSAQMGQERQAEENQSEQQQNQQDAEQSFAANAGTGFFLAVDVYTDQEAAFAINIMEQHGGKVTRMTVTTEDASPVPEEEAVRYIPPDADTHYAAEADSGRRLNTQEIPSSLRILPNEAPDTQEDTDLQNAPLAQGSSMNTSVTLHDVHRMPDLQAAPIGQETRYTVQQDMNLSVTLNDVHRMPDLQAAPLGRETRYTVQQDMNTSVNLHEGSALEQNTQDTAQQGSGGQNQNAQFSQFPYYPEPQSERTIPAEDGYDLDPIAPLSPQNFIDPNIGIGNYDLFDPATRTRDNSQPPENDQ